MKFILVLISIVTLFFSSCSSQNQDPSTLILRIENKESAYPRLSKDDTKILYQSNQTGPWQLLIMNITDRTQTHITSDTFNNNFPDWSTDNEWIAFTSDRDGNEEVYLMRTDGSGLKRITNDPGRDIHPYFSSDGRFILISSTRANGSFDIFRYSIADTQLEKLTDTPDDETCARYSPDMKQIVLLKNSSSSDDVFLMNPVDFTLHNLTNTPAIADGWPVFSHDNQWIFYSSHESGSFCLYKVKSDGSMKTKLSTSVGEDEDARACVSKDGSFLVYNKRSLNTIEIRKMKII